MFAFLWAANLPQQFVAHAIGDYLLQSGWMANNKIRSWVAASVHALVYSIPFLLMFHPSLAAWAVIVGTHALIDRYQLARYVSYAKEWLAPQRPRSWQECSKTGFDPQTPDYIARWLLIICDNIMHVLINAWALGVLG